jgi:multidrug efflux system membrane fusion protein
MTRRWITLSALALTAAAMVGCERRAGNAGAAPAAHGTPVIVSPAVSRNVPVYIDEIGKTVAREAVTIQPQVTGAIMQIHFQDGAQLHKGDLLFTIDPRPYEAAVKQAEAAKAQAEADAQWSQSELKRVQGLAGTGAVSAQDVESKQNALAVSEAKVKAADASLVTAKLNLGYCTIKSPIDGRAGQRLVDEGNIVQTGGPDGGTKLLTIQRLTPIYADFVMPEQNLSRVRQQMANHALKTLVRLPEDPETAAAEGELTFLDNMVVAGSGTIKLRATLPNKDAHFWPGQFVKVRLVLETIENAVLVPKAAEQIGQQGPFVYIAKEGDIVDPATKATHQGTVAELRIIKPGQQQGDMMVVLDGVKAGEQVITQGQMLLQPGAPIMVAPPAAAPEAPPTSKPAAVADGATKS